MALRLSFVFLFVCFFVFFIVVNFQLIADQEIIAAFTESSLSSDRSVATDSATPLRVATTRSVLRQSM